MNIVNNRRNKFMISAQSPLEKRTSRLQMSTIFYSSQKLPPLRQPSTEFIPFQNERDGIGRLIIKKKLSNLYPSHQRVRGQIMNEEQQTKQNKVMRIVGQFFRRHDPDWMTGKEQVFFRKGFVIKDKERKEAKPISEDYDTNPGLNKIKIKTKSCIIKKQNRKGSQMGQIKEKVVDDRSRRVREKKMELIKQERDENENKREVVRIPKWRLEQQHPDMRRYRQLKKWEIKIWNDFEEGDKKFKDRMQESKMIAQHIKKQLQLE